MKTFWILWHPEGSTPPKVRFGTLAEAVKTAEFMMEKIGNGTMFIMKAVGGIETLKRTKYVIAEGEKRK